MLEWISPFFFLNLDIKTLQSTSTKWKFYFSIDTVCRDQERIIWNMKIPFPEPVNTKISGHIPDGSPKVAISSPTEIIAALAAAKEGYM